MSLEKYLALASDVRAAKYPAAKTVLFCGSLSRGDGTETSDLDLVVLYEQVDAAYRESFVFDGQPTEVFVHDPNTLRYFFLKVDAPSGVPVLMSMVSEGVVVPGEDTLSGPAKTLANQVLSQGPVMWGQPEIDASRYSITNLVDDLRKPKSSAESVAIAADLYRELADFCFRINGKWSARGKHIPRQLREHDSGQADQFDQSFQAVMSGGDCKPLIELTQTILEPHGGFLFDGYQHYAPSQWRLV